MSFIEETSEIFTIDHFLCEEECDDLEVLARRDDIIELSMRLYRKLY